MNILVKPLSSNPRDLFHKPQCVIFQVMLDQFDFKLITLEPKLIFNTC